MRQRFNLLTRPLLCALPCLFVRSLFCLLIHAFACLLFRLSPGETRFGSVVLGFLWGVHNGIFIGLKLSKLFCIRYFYVKMFC